MKISKFIMAVGILFALPACNDDDTTVEEINGPTEINLISCDIMPDGLQTGDLAWKTRRYSVLNMIAQENPDIICMQGQYWKQETYLEQQLTAYEPVDYNVNGNNSNTGRHNTVMFRKDKYTLVEQGKFWLSQKPTSLSYPWAAQDNERRITAWVLLKDNKTNAKFYVASTMMNDGDTERDQEARLNSANLNVSKFQELMEKAEIDVPVIIAGNMNASNAETDPRRDCLAPYYKWMVGARETALTTDEIPSYNALGGVVEGRALTPDHIFLYNAAALSFKTLTGNYGVQYMSDHYPLYSKIKF